MNLQDLSAPLRRHRVLVAGALVLVALAAWTAPRVMGGPQVAVRRVVQRDFVESVVASGHVEAPHRVTIGAVVVGKVLRVPVIEGQAVSAGEVLVELDAAEWAAAASQADAAVAQAAARMRQIAEVDSPVAAQLLRQAEVNVDNARRQQARDTALLAQGFIGPAAMDDTNKTVGLAQAQWEGALAQRLAALPSGSAAAIAVAALAQARSAAAAAHARLANTVITAPVGGTLIARSVEAGDVVQPGAPLMVLSPGDAAQLVVDIDEKNLHLIALGQQARASADAFPDRLFDARIAYVNPGVDLQRGSVEVKLDVIHPPAFLRQDMTVSVDIQVAVRPHAIVVALDAVRDASGPHPWVWRVVDRRVRRQDVVLGVRSAGFAECLRGLSDGDQVVSAQAALAEGARVRPIA